MEDIKKQFEEEFIAYSQGKIIGYNGMQDALDILDWIWNKSALKENSKRKLLTTDKIISMDFHKATDVFPLFCKMRVNPYVPDDEIWVALESGERQKFKIL